MTKIILDDVLRNKFQDLSSPFELWDESGRFIGLFHPAVDPSRPKALESPISPAELERRSKEKGIGKVYTTAEVLAHLEKL